MITTDRDAKAQIADAIEATGGDYDLAAILRETHDFEVPHGYRQVVSPEQFWESVAAHEKAPAE